MSRKLLTHGREYEIDTRDITLRSEAEARTVWIVKIEDETGQTVTSARCSGTSGEVMKASLTWLNDLCRHNPGKLLRNVITQANN